MTGQNTRTKEGLLADLEKWREDRLKEAKGIPYKVRNVEAVYKVLKIGIKEGTEAGLAALNLQNRDPESYIDRAGQDCPAQ